MLVNSSDVDTVLLKKEQMKVIDRYKILYKISRTTNIANRSIMDKQIIKVRKWNEMLLREVSNYF